MEGVRLIFSPAYSAPLAVVVVVAVLEVSPPHLTTTVTIPTAAAAAAASSYIEAKSRNCLHNDSYMRLVCGILKVGVPPFEKVVIASRSGNLKCFLVHDIS